jgi:hypothetical protein
VNGDPLRKILFFTDVPDNIPMEEDRFNRIEEEHITSRCNYAITGKSAKNKTHLRYSQANPSGPTMLYPCIISFFWYIDASFAHPMVLLTLCRR